MSTAIHLPSVAALHGREADRDALLKMIGTDTARAVLVFGEPGIGRTSLLFEGIVPALAEQGVVVLTPGTAALPSQGFADAAQQATGLAPAPNERIREFLVRVVTSKPGKPTVFVIDDVDHLLLADKDGHIVEDLGGMFTRVTTMSKGQAHFVFSCADIRLHWIDALERRTGTLFPTACRLRLGRLSPEAARTALGDLCLQLALAAEPELQARLVELAAKKGGGVLPAELPIMARAIQELGLRTAADLERLETERPDLVWLERAAAATGDARGALRILGELGEAGGPVGAEILAQGACVDPDFAVAALAKLSAAGICGEAKTPRAEFPAFALSHEILAERAREVAGPARRSHTAARQALQAAAKRGRITPVDWWRVVRLERVIPATPEETKVLVQMRTLLRNGALGAAALLVVILLASLILGGRGYHYAVHEGRLAVRSGPSAGKVVADTGLSRDMVSPAAWREPKKVDAAYAAHSLTLMRPMLRSLYRYALTRDDGALAELKKELDGPDAWWEALRLLEPIAGVSAGETVLLKEALGNPVTAPAAFSFIAGTAARKEGAFASVLADVLVGEEPQARKQAARAVATLSPASRAAVYAQAAPHVHGTMAVEMLAALEEADLPVEPTAAAAVSILGVTDLPPDQREHAWRLLETLFARDLSGASRAFAKIAGDGTATPEARARALGFLDRTPKLVAVQFVAEIRAAASAKVAAALPLYARIAPAEAGALFSSMADAPPEVKAAMAVAWGGLAKDDPAGAQKALEAMLDYQVPVKVRVEAARAYGQLGAAAQDKLSAMALNEGGPASEAAILGLADTLIVGAGSGKVQDAIFKLWQKKGVSKRRAAAAAARIAGVKPAAVIDYLASAIHDPQDEALHPIGADGLCRAAGAGSATALSTLMTAADRADAATTARLAVCLAEHPELAAKLAPHLAANGDATVRAAAARALAGVKGNEVVAPLVRLVGDKDRVVRQAAAAGLAAVGEKSAEATAALHAAWNLADAEERVGLLAAAVAVGDDALAHTALFDTRAEVRRRALTAMVALKASGVADALEVGLADADPTVRGEALRLLEGASAFLPPERVTQALELALHDPDPAVAALAARRLGAAGDPKAIAARVKAGLHERTESGRLLAVDLGVGLATKDAAAGIAALSPGLADPAHDVRVKVVAALAGAYAQKPAAELARLLGGTERDAPMRLVYLTALLDRAASDAAAVQQALGPIADKGSPFAKVSAQLALALLKSGANGPAFVASLVP